MEHKTLAEIRARAAVVEPIAMTKREKIERWARALEARGPDRLRMLMGIEYTPPEVRGLLQERNSPLTVAYDDPVLRAAGLTGDSYAEAQCFFELSDSQMHRLLCGCHLGANVSGAKMAGRLRGVTDPIGSIMRYFSNFGARA